MAAQPNPVTFDQAQSTARRVILAASASAEQIERGQATVPLGDLLRRLESELDTDAWTPCAVVATEALAPLLRWLCGRDLIGVHALNRTPGILELTFNGERFVLETGSGAQFFDTFSDLLAALALAPADAQGRSEGEIRVGAPEPRVAGARLNIVLGAEQLGTDPNLGAALLNRSNALWLVSTPEWSWDSATRLALRSLCESMDLVGPVIITTPAQAIPAAGWWTDVALGRARQPPLHLRADEPPVVPSLLANGRGALRRALHLASLQRRLKQALEAVKERLELLRQQLRARRQKEERNERALGDGAADGLTRGPLEAARAGLADELSALQRGLKETSRRGLSREGALAQAVASLVQSVSPDDLSRSEIGRVIALSLDEAVTARFARELRQCFKEELRRDLVTIRDGLRVATEAVQKRLQEALGISMPLDLQPPDERPIREVLTDVLQLELRYRGELPRRGFVQRLGEGRRVLFLVLMSVSLFGGLLTGGKNVRSMLGPFGLVFLLLFVGSVIWTYRAWHREDEHRITREIDKIREQLQSEAMRLVREAERERLTRLTEAIENIRKEALKRVEEFGRQLTQQAAANQARELGAVRDRLRVIDQRAKELDTTRSTLQRAEQDSSELARQAETLLRQALAPPPTPT
jgi:hypothetical protein